MENVEIARQLAHSVIGQKNIKVKTSTMRIA